jgi:hypothetical protein
LLYGTDVGMSIWPPCGLHYILDSHNTHNRFPKAKESLYGNGVGVMV